MWNGMCYPPPPNKILRKMYQPKKEDINVLVWKRLKDFTWGECPYPSAPTNNGRSLRVAQLWSPIVHCCTCHNKRQQSVPQTHFNTSLHLPGATLSWHHNHFHCCNATPYLREIIWGLLYHWGWLCQDGHMDGQLPLIALPYNPIIPC